MGDDNPWNCAIARAIKDPAFKERLISAPVATLREAGVAVPDGIRVRVFQNTEHEVNLVLPSTSTSDAATDAELERAVGGAIHSPCTNKLSGCATVVGA